MPLPAHGGKFFGWNLSVSNNSLSEAVMATSIHASAVDTGGTSVAVMPDVFKDLLHPYPSAPNNQQHLRVRDATSYWECGNGHVIQRLHRLLGLPVPIKPKGSIRPIAGTVPGRIAIHMKPSKWGYMCGRMSIGSKKILKEWSKDKDVDFIAASTDFRSVWKRVSECEFFIGVPAGPLHLATGLGKKVVGILKYPRAKEIILPIIKNVCDPELAWLYPQNVHLHESDECRLVRRLSFRSLDKAIDGRVYPFWSEGFLNVINSYV